MCRAMDLIVDFPRQRHSPQHKPAPRVSFAVHRELKFIENLTFHHKDDLWFSSEEMKGFKYQALIVLKAMSSNNMSMIQFAEMNIHETSAFMGLENFLSDRTARNVANRRRAIGKAVMEEHARQLSAGIHDPESLSVISEALSEISRKRARIIGAIHADKNISMRRFVSASTVDDHRSSFASSEDPSSAASSSSVYNYLGGYVLSLRNSLVGSDVSSSSSSDAIALQEVAWDREEELSVQNTEDENEENHDDEELFPARCRRCPDRKRARFRQSSSGSLSSRSLIEDMLANLREELE